MSLHMLHLPLHARALAQCSREHGLLTDGWATDLGYQVHALLARLFDKQAPKPFDVQPEGETPHLLGYTSVPLAGLEAVARAGGDAPALAAIGWERAGSRPMPEFAAGQSLGFRVRVCPVVRVGRHHPLFRHGAEVDAWLVAAKRLGEADELPLREAVYAEWLAARLAPAAKLQGARLTALRDARLWRRGEPGKPDDRMQDKARRERVRNGRAPIGRREAVFEGRLTVADPDAFAILLARGVGRHRAFGFGMLLLRPTS